MQKIRKGDKVVVLTGKDKGRKGEVMQVMPKDDRAVVAGVTCCEAPPAPDADQEAGIISQGSADPPVQPRASPIPRTASRPASASASKATARFALPSVREK